MTNSRSNRLAAIAVLVVAVIGLGGGVASAAPRKRVVVLDFEGPKAEKFHDDLVRMVKKNYTLVPTDKWNGTADQLNAGKPTDANVKKIAKKLKIDGVITGRIEKRRDEYLVHLKLRSGKTGGVSNSADTKSSGPRLDGKASSDIKDELLDAIDQLGSAPIKGGDDDDADDDADAKPAPKKKPPAAKKGTSDDDDDDADVKPAPKKKPPAAKKVAPDDDDGDIEPKHSKFGKKPVAKSSGGDDDDDADAKPPAKKPPPPPPAKKKPVEDEDAAPARDASHDDDDSPLKAGAKRPIKAAATKPPEDGSDDKANPDDDAGSAKKKVATKTSDDDDGEGVSKGGDDHRAALDPALALSPGQRAIDGVLGLSVTSRSLGFTYSANLTNHPPGYRGVPVAGAYLDGVVYPLAIGHKREGILTGLGLAFTYDRVLHVSSQVRYTDGAGASQVASQDSAADRWSIGAAFRYPFNKTAMSPVIGAQLRFGQQDFLISQTLPAGAVGSPDIPSVSYTSIEPSVNFHYPVSTKVELIANLGVQLVSGTGMIQQMDQYGQASVVGLDVEVGGDYLITKNIFARASVRVESIGYTFAGTGAMTTTRDGNAATQDVFGARDSYFGGTVTVGYLY